MCLERETFIGCTEAVRTNGEVSCLFCNEAGNFALKGGLCSCNEGYELNAETCQPVCGDGNRLAEELCDDGNLEDDDGCSRLCEFEEGFICSEADGKVKCLRQATVALNYECTFQSGMKNKASIQLAFDPHFKELRNLDCQSSVYFELENEPSDFSCFVEGEKLRLEVDFNSSIEDSAGFVKLKFDRAVIISPNAEANFTVKGCPSPLVFFQDLEKIETISRMNFGVVGLFALIALVGLATFPKIAVETIHGFQLTFFATALNIESAGMKGFSPLALSSGYGNVFEVGRLIENPPLAH